MNNHDILMLMNEKDCKKVLITVSPDGKPNAVFKDRMYYLPNENRILTLELTENSETNQYMTHAIWFNRCIMCLIATPNNESYLIECRPYRAIISGMIFEQYYQQVKESGFDLSTIWVLEPISTKNKTLKQRFDEEEEKHPLNKHLDRLM